MPHDPFLHLSIYLWLTFAWRTWHSRHLVLVNDAVATPHFGIGLHDLGTVGPIARAVGGPLDTLQVSELPVLRALGDDLSIRVRLQSSLSFFWAAAETARRTQRDDHEAAHEQFHVEVLFGVYLLMSLKRRMILTGYIISNKERHQHSKRPIIQRRIHSTGNLNWQKKNYEVRLVTTFGSKVFVFA